MVVSLRDSHPMTIESFEFFVWFERLNRVLQQQVQLRVVHVGLASLKAAFFRPQVVQVPIGWSGASPEPLTLFGGFFSLNTAFLWSKHFMSKNMLSTCAGTNWTDLNVEVSARPWPNIPIWNFIQMSGLPPMIQHWSNGPRLWRSHSKEVVCTFETFWFGDSQEVFFLFVFWVVCRPFPMRKQKHMFFFFKVGCCCCGFESRFWDVPFWGHAASHLSLLEEGSHSHQVGKSPGE